MTFTETETIKAARKSHICEWCGQRIAVGEEYRRYRFFDCGDAGTVKMHPECLADMQTVAREEGGEFEFTRGGAERPPKLIATESASQVKP